MEKRGRKSYEPGLSVMPLDEIAKRIGVSARTVFTDYHSAIEKLKEQPDAYSILLATVHAVADERVYAEMDALQPGSLECRPEFRELNSFDID